LKAANLCGRLWLRPTTAACGRVRFACSWGRAQSQRDDPRGDDSGAIALRGRLTWDVRRHNAPSPARGSMGAPQTSILRILSIAHDHSREGSGIPLHDLISRSGIADLRSEITNAALTSVLANRPELAVDWCRFSENKRTSGGCYLVHEGASWIVDRLGSALVPDERTAVPSLTSACAEFARKGLDFWTAIDCPRPGSAALQFALADAAPAAGETRTCQPSRRS